MSVIFFQFWTKIGTSRRIVIRLDINMHQIQFVGSQTLRKGRATESLVKLWVICKFWRFADRASQYIYLSNKPTWCTKFLFYNKFISCLYMFRAHVLIIRRAKLHYTASGIITHVLETCRDMKQTYCKTKILCIKLVNYWDKYTEMHGKQNVKKNIIPTVALCMELARLRTGTRR